MGDDPRTTLPSPVVCALALSIALACDGSVEPEARPVRPDARIAARAGGTEITLEELDAPLELKLHDLERAAYELRRRRLDQLLAQRGAVPGEAEILLAPPDAPRLDVPVDAARVRGNTQAPVTILEFIDYESANCRRMQPVLQRVLAAYEGRVRLAVRDFPQAFHRRAGRVAEAARCAGIQDDYWAFHDVAFQEQGAFADDDLLGYARRVGLDAERFAACVQSRQFEQAVEADRALAEELGLPIAPTLIVNGRYLRGPQDFDTLAALIDAELDPRLELVGTVVVDDPAQSMAAIRGGGIDDTRLLQPGDQVLPGVRLTRVERTQATLERDGSTEVLHLLRTPASTSPSAAVDSAAIVLDLERSEVQRGLRDRPALDEVAAPAPLDLAGKRLLKLTAVPEGSLLERLGLRARDVPVLLDDALLTDDLAPLWDALETRDEFTLVVMRRGLPHRYHYTIR